jgi:hypothetical protein
MAIMTLVTGDPLIKKINLTKISASGEATFNIPTSGVPVTVAVVSNDHARRLTSEVTVSSAETGSDWTTSTIVVNIDKVETEAIEETGLALLEIQVNDGDEITWFHPLNIINGQIA